MSYIAAVNKLKTNSSKTETKKEQINKFSQQTEMHVNKLRK